MSYEYDSYTDDNALDPQARDALRQTQYRQMLAQGLMSRQDAGGGPYSGLANMGNDLLGATMMRNARNDAWQIRNGFSPSMPGVRVTPEVDPNASSWFPRIFSFGAP